MPDQALRNHLFVFYVRYILRIYNVFVEWKAEYCSFSRAPCSDRVGRTHRPETRNIAQDAGSMRDALRQGHLIVFHGADKDARMAQEGRPCIFDEHVQIQTVVGGKSPRRRIVARLGVTVHDLGYV